MSQALKNALKNEGLLLFGSLGLLNNFTFERPFALWGDVSCQNVVGGYSYINARTQLENATIGRYSCIAHDCVVGLLRHDSRAVMMSSLTCFEGLSSHGVAQWSSGVTLDDIRPAHTSIGHGVWVGAHALVPAAKPISIANGAIIAAGAVLTKDAPAYAVMGGNPARVLKMRFDERICEELERTAWWEYDWGLARASLPRFYAPLSEAGEFCAWWRDEGKALLTPFKMSGIKSRIYIQNGRLLLQKC